MMAVPYGSGRGRTAASNYQTLQALAGGGAALVQWKLESGRTHQIRWVDAALHHGRCCGLAVHYTIMLQAFPSLCAPACVHFSTGNTCPSVV
jgi:hypothetical protein